MAPRRRHAVGAIADSGDESSPHIFHSERGRSADPDTRAKTSRLEAARAGEQAEWLVLAQVDGPRPGDADNVDGIDQE